MMKRRISLVAIVAMAAFLTPPATAATAAQQPAWDMTGTYTIHYLCISGCSGEYDHSDSITVTDQNMTDPEVFSGTGTYVINGVPQAGYSETVTGTLTGSDLVFDVLYTGTNPGYTVHAIGAVADDGSLSGEADSSMGQHFTWTATGKARPFGYTTAGDCGTVTYFIDSYGTPVTNLPTVAGHKYEVTAIGTYYAGGVGNYDIIADAEYSQDRAQFAAGDPWTALVNGYETTDTGLLDLWVNGAKLDWGAFNNDHWYQADFVAPDASTQFTLNIYDSGYKYNNTGGLCVSLVDLGRIGTFDGFFEPITMDMTNVAKAGRVIPIKWRALDWYGNPISDLTVADVAVRTNGAGDACGTAAPDVVEQYVAMSGLQYMGDGYWQFNWKTPLLYAGTCRTMTLSLYGDDVASAEFLFR